MKVLRDLRILRTIPLLIVVFFASIPTYAKYSGGTGEPNDTYQIAAAADPIARRSCCRLLPGDWVQES
jgi:hypothetical protein